MEQFDARLEELAIDCDYGNCIKDRLKEQLINGVRDNAFKKKLLGSMDNSLTDFLKKARTFKQVAQDVRSSRQGESSFSGTHFVKQSRAYTSKLTRLPANISRSPAGFWNSAKTSRAHQTVGNQPFWPCPRCGGLWHFAESYWYRDKE